MSKQPTSSILGIRRTMEKDKLIIKTLIDIHTCLDNIGHLRNDPIQLQLNEIEKDIKELEELNDENIG